MPSRCARTYWLRPISPFTSLVHSIQGTEIEDGNEMCRLRLSLEEMEAVWKRRLEDRVPIQYLTNTVHWRDVVLAVGPGILIPRPETEKLIDLAEIAIQKNAQLLHVPWADLGTGSGAIAICLARLFQKRGSRSVIHAIDLRPECIECARRNAERLQVLSQIRLAKGDWFEPLRKWKGRMGGLVSNPPYIPSTDLPELQPEVGWHEPTIALDGGPDGSEALRRLVGEAAGFLMVGGVLLMETNGKDQSSAAAEGLTSGSPSGFRDVEIHRDLSGVERFVSAVRC